MPWIDEESPLQFSGTTGRSAKNNNPLNLEYRPGSYQDKYGAMPEPTHGGRFAKFPSMEAGYQAGLDQIRLDQQRGLTLGQFVNKFAPPFENPTTQLVAQYGNAVGANANTPLANIPPERLAVPMLARESSTRIRYAGMGQPRQAQAQPKGKWVDVEEGTGFWESGKEALKRSVADLVGSYGSFQGQRKGETREQARQRIAEATGRGVGITGQKPSGIMGEIGSVLGSLPVPLAELILLNKALPGGGGVAGSMARGAATFGAQSAIHGGSATKGAIEGAAFGLLPPGWSRAKRFLGGAGIGLGSTYAEPGPKTSKDYAKGALVPGILAGAHAPVRPGQAAPEAAREPDRVYNPYLEAPPERLALPPGAQLRLTGPEGFYSGEDFTMGPHRARRVPADDLQLTGPRVTGLLPPGYAPDFTMQYTPDFIMQGARRVPADDLMLPLPQKRLPGPGPGQLPEALAPKGKPIKWESVWDAEWSDISDEEFGRIREKPSEFQGVTEPKGDIVERLQWMRNKEGGQGYGNQEIILRASPEIYNQYIKDKMRGKPTYDQAVKRGWVDPSKTGISLVRVGGEGDWRLSKVDNINNLRSKGEAAKWAKTVDNFSSQEAQKFGKTADSDVFPLPKPAEPLPEPEKVIPAKSEQVQEPDWKAELKAVRDRIAPLRDEIFKFKQGHEYFWRNWFKDNFDPGTDWNRIEGKVRDEAARLLKIPEEQAVTEAKKYHEYFDLKARETELMYAPKSAEPLPEPEKVIPAKSEPTPAKEPWQMTRDDFLKRDLSFLKPDERDHELWELGQNHKGYVEQALSRGLPVPPEVLKDYPDLQPKEAGTTPPSKEIDMKFGEHIGGSRFDKARGILTLDETEPGERPGTTKLYGGLPLPEWEDVKRWYKKDREPLRFSGHTWDDIKYSVGKYFGATRTPEGARAKRLVTKFMSRWQADKLQTEAVMGDAERRYGNLDKQGFAKLVTPIQRGGKSSDLAFQKLYDLYHDTSDKLWTRINEFKPLAYLQDYFRQAWTNADDPAIQENIKNYFAGKPFVNHLDTDFQGKPKVDTRPYGGRTLTGGRAYFKHRVIPDVETGLMLGLEPREPNPVRAMMNDLSEKSHFVRGMEFIDTEFKAKELKWYRPGAQPTGWQPVNDPALRFIQPYLQKVLESRAAIKKTGQPVDARALQYQAYAPEEVARVINNWLGKGFRGEPWYDAYRGLVDPLRKIGVSLSTYHLKLMLNLDMAMRSGQHMNKALGDILTGDAVGAAKQIKEAGKTWSGYVFAREQLSKHGLGKNLIEEMLKPGAHPELAEMATDMRDAGLLPHSATSLKPVTEAMKGSLKDAAIEGMNTLGSLAKGKPLKALRSAWGSFDKFLNATAAPIMEYAVPRAKATAFGFLRKAWLKENGKKYGGVENIPPEVKAQGMYDLARHVDHMMGEINYDALHFNRKLRDVLFFAIKYPGWNIGSANWMMTGARGAMRTLTGRETTTLDKTAFRTTLGLLASVGITGLMTQYLLTGTFPDNPGDLWTKGIKTGGKNQWGEDEYVRDATYLRDIHGMWHDPAKTIQSKSPDVFRVLGEIYNNSDYFGTDIWDKTAPAGTQAKQFGSYVGQQFLPYSIRSSTQAQTPFAKYGSFLGLTPTPRWLTETPMQKEMSEAAQRHQTKRTRPQYEEYKARNDLVKGYLQDQDINTFKSGLQQMVKQGMTPQKAKESFQKAMAPDIYRFWHITDANTLLSAYEKANPKERARYRSIFIQKMENKYNLEPEWIRQNAERLRKVLQ